LGDGWRALRRRILTPDVSETSLDKRGFHKKSPQAQELLETVGEKFLLGYAHAVEARTPAQCEEWLGRIPEQFRGFAYEGAGMGYAMLDGLPFGGRRHIENFVAGPGGAQQHYIILVGVGWAMARLPRFAWPKADRFDPLLRWLVLDGYGFHQAYFKTGKYIRQQYQDRNFSWPDRRYDGYALRAIDQGIGRALWFVEGADVDRLATTIEGFAPARHADLFAGAGLAATYAGGVGRTELESLRRRAGRYVPQLAQGSAFGAEARLLAGLTTSHTALATDVLCGMTPQRAAAVTDAARIDLTDGGPAPDYEIWRQRIATQFASSGRY